MCGILTRGTPQVGRRWDAGRTQEKINSSERGFGV